MVGGGGERLTLRVVARHADQWNAFGSPETFKRKIALLEGYCREIGRDPAAIEKSVLLQLKLTADQAEANRFLSGFAEARGLPPEEARWRFLAGPTEAIERQIRAYLDVGVSHFILTLYAPYDEDALHRFAERVMPAFRA
jgi:alkanesulfonate monooxygenase SsuD/methylene tetrahydromethanopterin reductase-like flavin-dependent oxidoreductase (luciferase family)